MSELFKKEDFLTKDAKADDAFTKSYRGMTDEIDRVASEPVTIWAALTKWIYGKIFGDSDHLKEKQDSRDKYRSAAVYNKVRSSSEIYCIGRRVKNLIFSRFFVSRCAINFVSR